MPESVHLSTALAPTGRLRASINLGNPILAHRHPVSGEVGGVSVDLSRELARQLALPLDLVVFDKAAQSVDAVRSEQADLGFFAIDPLRGEGIQFTAPYVLIEGSYLVRHDSPLQSNDEVDQPGHRVVVGQGSAYDLHLSRAIQQASLVRAPSSPEVVPVFLAQNLEVAAGVKQQLEADARRLGAQGHQLRLLPGRFMVIQQAMGLPNSRGTAAAEFLRAFVEEMKTSGFVAQALANHGIQGASVAPPAGTVVA